MMERVLKMLGLHSVVGSLQYRPKALVTSAKTQNITQSTPTIPIAALINPKNKGTPAPRYAT